MRHLLADLPTEGGVLILGHQQRGCRHCGTIEIHASACGKVAWYHPGTSCCADAVKDQERWRNEEIEGMRAQYRAAAADIDDLERALEEATGPERTRLKNEIARARAGLDRKQQYVWGPKVEGIRGEIAELKRHLLRLGDPALREIAP